MALNFTVSYTFSPNTTISSSQVNTNTSDVASVFQGLEALTKTMAKLKVDVDPTTALEVATKQYVDHLTNWRRPVLQYNSATVVNVETGLDGTSGDCTILFPDGNLRTDTATGRIQCNLAQVAALSGSWQSGLRTGSASANTWYSFYAVKTTDNSSHFVIVADTVIPTQGNYATLNSNFGTNGWVYLGTLPYGDNSGSTTSVPTFVMSGNAVLFSNATTATGSIAGVKLTSTAGATSLTYTYASGTAIGSGQIPTHLAHALYTVGKSFDAAGRGLRFLNSAGTVQYGNVIDTAENVSAVWRSWLHTTGGLLATDLNSGSANAVAINLAGYSDLVLGVGANPLL